MKSINWTGKNTEEVQEYFKKTKPELNQYKEFVLGIVDPWLLHIEKEAYSKNEKKQKRKELFDVASFIHSYNPELTIINGLNEKPDMIIKNRDEVIGVELVDVYINKEAKQREGTLQNYFDSIEDELNTQTQNLNGIYRINFTREFQYRDKQLRDQLKPKIIDAIVNNTDLSNAFIRSIDKSPHTRIHLYTGNPSMIGDLKRTTIEEIVETKTSKLNTYKSSDYSQLWLLMVIGGVQASSDYDKIEPSVYEEQYKSGFDKLLLYNFFDRQFYDLPTKHD